MQSALAGCFGRLTRALAFSSEDSVRLLRSQPNPYVYRIHHSRHCFDLKRLLKVCRDERHFTNMFILRPPASGQPLSGVQVVPIYCAPQIPRSSRMTHQDAPLYASQDRTERTGSRHPPINAQSRNQPPRLDRLVGTWHRGVTSVIITPQDR